jgi:hypothetical protein
LIIKLDGIVIPEVNLSVVDLRCHLVRVLRYCNYQDDCES